MEQNFVLTHNLPGTRRMIGTPCVYKTNVIKNNFDPKFTGPSDDTDLCYRLHKLNYKLGVGKSRVFKFIDQIFLILKKFIWYGKGDVTVCLVPQRKNIKYFKTYYL